MKFSRGGDSFVTFLTVMFSSVGVSELVTIWRNKMPLKNLAFPELFLVTVIDRFSIIGMVVESAVDVVVEVVEEIADVVYADDAVVVDGVVADVVCCVVVVDVVAPGDPPPELTVCVT